MTRFANAVGTQADFITHYGPSGSFNTLFNGKNINPVGPGGEAFQWTVQPCRKHRFRIINRSVWSPSSRNQLLTIIVALRKTCTLLASMPIT